MNQLKSWNSGFVGVFALLLSMSIHAAVEDEPRLTQSAAEASEALDVVLAAKEDVAANKSRRSFFDFFKFNQSVPKPNKTVVDSMALESTAEKAVVDARAQLKSQVDKDPAGSGRVLSAILEYFRIDDDSKKARRDEYARASGAWLDVYGTGKIHSLTTDSLTKTSRYYQEPVLLSGEQVSLNHYVRLVARSNDRIEFQRMEWAIAESAAYSARGVYEPELTGSYRVTDSNIPNTTEEEFRRSFSPEFIEKNEDYSFGVEATVPTGGKIKLAFTNRDLDNNIQPEPIRGQENKSYLGLSVTQPLLKGAGGKNVVGAPITVAVKDAEIARQTYRLALFESVSNAGVAYWDLYMAEKKLELRQRSLAIVESILNDEKQRSRLGKSSEIQVMNSESVVAQRRVQKYAAEQDLVQAKNRLKSFVTDPSDSSNLAVDLDSELSPIQYVPPRLRMLSDAFAWRPEYIASLVRADKEDVKIAFARNNKLPQLDLVASYGLNGLDKDVESAWKNLRTEDHKTMYVGLEFRVPLLGNKRAKGELAGATLRKHQALLEIQATEAQINSSVDTALNNLKTSFMQVAELERVVGNNARLLEVEIARYAAGKSNSRDVLDLEERINQTLEIDLQSRVNLQKAIIGVGLADGTLLKKFGLE